MGCDEAVYLASALVFFEGCYRYFKYISMQEIMYNFEIRADYNMWVEKGPAFVYFYIICMLSTYLYVAYFYDFPIFKNPWFQNSVPYLYILDSIGAIIMGVGLYKGNIEFFYIGLVFLTNFFLMHILHRIFAGKKPNSMHDELVSTTKSYLHHLASFFYIRNKIVLIITVIWRAISMSGHAAQALSLKKHISSQQLYRFNWLLSHVRNCIVLYILFQCYHDPELRIGFGESAIGHIAYMLVRAGPVFRLGSVYVGDKALWQSHTDWKRLKIMLSGQYPFITFEIGSLLFLSILFLYWKFTI